jgi:hypothetical protein
VTSTHARGRIAALAALAAVVLLLAATGAASYRFRDADPRPTVLFSEGSMTLSPSAVRPGQVLHAGFTTTRVRLGLLTVTSPSGSFVLGNGRLLRIPASGRIRLTQAMTHPPGRADARSFSTRIPVALPAGHYRACSLDEPAAGPSIAECSQLTVLGG